MSLRLLNDQRMEIVTQILMVSCQLDQVRRNLGNVEYSPGDRQILAGMEAQLMNLFHHYMRMIKKIDKKIDEITRLRPPPPPPPAPTAAEE